MQKVLLFIGVCVLGGFVFCKSTKSNPTANDLLLNAISTKTEFDEIIFSVTENLRGQVIPLDTALFRYPYRLRMNEDRVVIEDLHGMDHFFHLFTYPDFRYLSSFGQRGQGPEEMITVDDCRWLGNSFWGLDNAKSELVRWDFDESRTQMLRKERVKLDKATFRAFDFVFFKNGSVLIPNFSGDTRFCQVDRNGKLIKKWGEIPTENQEALKESPHAFGQGWSSFIDYSSKLETLVAVTQLGEVLEIWNTKKNTHKVIKGKLGEPKFKMSQDYAIPSGIKGYNDVQVTERAIYTIFAGLSFKEVMDKSQKGINLPEGGSTIRVFSLEGKPLKEYKLDHSVCGIWVDEQVGKMWALDVNCDEPLVEYSIK